MANNRRKKEPEWSKRYKPKIIYDKGKRKEYIDNVSLSRTRIRSYSLNEINRRTNNWHYDVCAIENVLEEIRINLSNINRQFTSGCRYRLRWSTSESIKGIHGPYWILEHAKDESFIDSLEIKSTKKHIGPTLRQCKKVYGNGKHLDEIWAMRNKVKKLIPLREKLLNKIEKVVKVISNMNGQYFRTHNSPNKIDKELNQTQVDYGQSVRANWICFSTEHILRIVEKTLNNYEDTIEKNFLDFNATFPSRFSSIRVKWKLFSNAKNYKAKKFSPFGPLAIEWMLIWRLTHNIHGDGIRLLKRIKKPTHQLVYKSQLGKYRREIRDIYNEISRTEKKRQKLLKSLRKIWPYFMSWECPF